METTRVGVWEGLFLRCEIEGRSIHTLQNGILSYFKM